MGARTNVKREKHIEAAKAAAAALGAKTLNPDILFGRASKDDLEHYTGPMLAASGDGLTATAGESGGRVG